MIFLITGGTGLVGKKLIKVLLEANHTVRVLSRSAHSDTQVSYFKWDIDKDFVDPAALKEVDVLIHLAGAGVADAKWTAKRKKEIIDSRVKPLQLLEKAFKEQNTYPKKIVSASAVGIYGFDTGDTLLTEVSKSGADYLSKVVEEWEGAVKGFATAGGIKAAMLRIGIVLDLNGGALPQLALPVKLGVGSPIGDGKQWISWIHVEDLCRMFLKASIADMEGAYNAVAPDPERNKDFVKVLAKVLDKPLWAPAVPEFVLKIMLGERSQMVLGGNKVSAIKVKEAGFTFNYPDLEKALTDLYA